MHYLQRKLSGFMFFCAKQRETPLTEAVINNDPEIIRRLGPYKDHRYTKNSLGFNAIEIARYLGKEECATLLEPQQKKMFNVLLKGEQRIRQINQSELESCCHFHYRSHLRFADYDTFKKALKQRSWENVFSFSEKQVEEVILLYQQKIETGFFADVTIKWIDDILGYGLFTNRQLKKGNYVGEFTGCVSLCFDFPFSLPFDFNPYCFSYPRSLLSFRHFVIDAQSEGNEMRFVNHSSYAPLLTPKIVVDRRLVHVIFVAAVDIPKGTQLTYDYGEDYWRYREPPLDL